MSRLSVHSEKAMILFLACAVWRLRIISPERVPCANLNIAYFSSLLANFKQDFMYFHDIPGSEMIYLYMGKDFDTQFLVYRHYLERIIDIFRKILTNHVEKSNDSI